MIVCKLTQMDYPKLRNRVYTQTRLNECKSALAFATWAIFVFECVRMLRVRSKTFRMHYSVCVHVKFRLQRQGNEMNLRALFSLFIDCSGGVRTHDLLLSATHSSTSYLYRVHVYTFTHSYMYKLPLQRLYNRPARLKQAS